MTPSWTDWTDANQSFLVAELARLKAVLRGDPGGASGEAVDKARAALPAPPAIDTLSDAFSLSGFERDLLLLCAGVEMDGELASLCAQGPPGRQHATFGLALSALAEPHWSALAPVRPLRRWKMVEPADDCALVSARLRIDERVLHYLTGINYLDPRLQPLLRRVAEPEIMAGSQEAMAHEIAVAMTELPLPVVQLAGDDVDGKRDVAARAASACGLQLFAVSDDDLPANPQELELVAVLWERETVLLDAALLVECRAEPAAAVKRLMERIAGLVVLAAGEPVSLSRRDLRYRVDKPGRREQIRLWTSVLNGRADRYGPVLEGVASEFRLSAQDVQRIGRRLGPHGTDGADVDGADGAGADGADGAGADLWRACREVERVRLGGLAQRIAPAAAWEDLVLPEPEKAMLAQIASQVGHRLRVYEEWGFGSKGSRGLGISALFSGESGTGKTMAAEVLANQLHLDLYRIDLSAVVSKYIGETEKNLAQVFDAAESGGVVLLFDEADALFGKRSEVKDSHDRYANIEVSYLLQRMEAYRGLAILTTNQKAALDSAFQRRLRFMIHFPFPDAAEREEIWRRSFPDATPTSDLAYPKLARLQMTGGHIRNIALTAAFHAAEADEPVTMAHLLRAAHAEATKRDRGLTDAETRGWM